MNPPGRRCSDVGRQCPVRGQPSRLQPVDDLVTHVSHVGATRCRRSRCSGVRPTTSGAKRLSGSSADRRHLSGLTTGGTWSWPSKNLAGCVKTSHLYHMGSRLVNVRLDEERLRKARKLRESGVALSDVVREAIDARYEALRKLERPRDVKAVLSRIFERYPDPPDLPPRTYDVHDRKAARVAIADRLRRPRR